MGVKLRVTGQHSGAVTLKTRVECTTRAIEPCAQMPSHLNPTADHPITLTIVQSIGFTGSDRDEPITKETPTPSPTSETGPSPETTGEQPTATASPSI